MSDDSLAFCPTMYNRGFTWVETRGKSELRVRLVPLNMLKLSIFFLLAQISSIVFLNVKNLAFTPYCGVWWWWGGGGEGQDVITIQTSTMTPLSARVSRVSTGVGGRGSGYKCISLLQRVLVYACANITMKMNTDGE